MARILREWDSEVVALDRQRLDLGKPEALESYCREHRPEIVVSAGPSSWYEFTQVFRLAGVETELVHIPGSEYSLLAVRLATGSSPLPRGTLSGAGVKRSRTAWSVPRSMTLVAEGSLER